MDREQVWFESFKLCVKQQEGMDASAYADDVLELFDERFGVQDEDKFGLDNLPTWDDLLDGVQVEDAFITAYYQEGANQFMLKGIKSGRSGAVYTNQKTSVQAEMEYLHQATNWIVSILEQLDEQE